LHEVFSNTFHKHEMIFYKNNVATDTDSLPTVKVFDADTSASIATGTAINEEGLGQYYYQITPTVSSVDRNLLIQWSYSFNSVSATENSYAAVVTPYATLPEIISELKIGVSPSDENYITPEEILFAERVARIQINNYCNQYFNKRYDSQTEYGVNADSLSLTERMLSVDEIYEDEVLVYRASAGYNALGDSIIVSDTGKTINIINSNLPGDVPRANYSEYPIYQSSTGRFKQNKRYRVVGTIGWPYVPQDIRAAAVMLVSDYLTNDYQWRNRYLSKVNLTEVTFELNSAAFSSTGNAIVDSILDQYKNIVIVVI